MGFFSKLFHKHDLTEEHPLKITQKSDDESQRSLDKIKEYQQSCLSKSLSSNSEKIFDNIPDMIIKKIIFNINNDVQFENSETIRKLLFDINKEKSVDSADLVVTLNLINQKNDLNDKIKSYLHKQFLSTDDRHDLMNNIIMLIGLNEGLLRIARINQHLYYGWLNYFKDESPITIENIKRLINKNIKSLSYLDKYLS